MGSATARNSNIFEIAVRSEVKVCAHTEIGRGSQSRLCVCVRVCVCACGLGGPMFGTIFQFHQGAQFGTRALAQPLIAQWCGCTQLMMTWAPPPRAIPTLLR